MLSLGNAISGAPICSGMTKLPNAATATGTTLKNTKDRAMHGAKRVMSPSLVSTPGTPVSVIFGDVPTMIEEPLQ